MTQSQSFRIDHLHMGVIHVVGFRVQLALLCRVLVDDDDGPTERDELLDQFDVFEKSGVHCADSHADQILGAGSKIPHAPHKLVSGVVRNGSLRYFCRPPIDLLPGWRNW